MVFASGLAELGLAFLIGVALANYFKFKKAEKGLNWIALAGIWFLFAGSFSIATLYGPDILSTYVGASTWQGIQAIFAIIGWIFALIGTLFVAYEVLAEK